MDEIFDIKYETSSNASKFCRLFSDAIVNVLCGWNCVTKHNYFRDFAQFF